VKRDLRQEFALRYVPSIYILSMYRNAEDSVSSETSSVMHSVEQNMKEKNVNGNPLKIQRIHVLSLVGLLAQITLPNCLQKFGMGQDVV